MENNILENLENSKDEKREYDNILNFSSNKLEAEKEPVLVNINPETGTEDIIGEFEIDKFQQEDDSIENMSDSIENVDINSDALDNCPITDEEMSEYINDKDNNSLINDISSDKPELSLEATKELLDVVNRKLKGEKFNIFKALPEDIKVIIEKYVNQNIDKTLSMNTINAVKNNVAEALLDDFINDIQLKRMKNDFATDLENLYKDSVKEIASGALEYIDERNKAYRDAADNIEDQEKKEKMLAIIDQIDEARSLSTLKEFSKHCKIKSIELEKPGKRVYSQFLYKYKNSANNIYDLELCKKVLFRHLEKDGITIRDIDAFLISFCKQCKNMSSSKPVEHAYMYYVLYYCALLDGDNSEVFKNNVKEVIYNLRNCNNILK